ncbi:hypothetical protein V8F20_003420 [Naviculisporaceae sp. PSN 640]
MPDESDWFLPSDLLDKDDERRFWVDPPLPQAPAPPAGFRPLAGHFSGSTHAPSSAPAPAAPSALPPVPAAPLATFTRPQRPHVIRRLPKAQRMAVAQRVPGAGPQGPTPPQSGQVDVYTAAASAQYGNNNPIAGKNMAVSGSHAYLQGHGHGHGSGAGYSAQLGGTDMTRGNRVYPQVSGERDHATGFGNETETGVRTIFPQNTDSFEQSAFPPFANTANQLNTALPGAREGGQTHSHQNMMSGLGNVTRLPAGGGSARLSNVAQDSFGARMGDLALSNPLNQFMGSFGRLNLSGEDELNMGPHGNSIPGAQGAAVPSRANTAAGFGIMNLPHAPSPGQTPVGFATQSTLSDRFGTMNRANAAAQHQGLIQGLGKFGHLIGTPSSQSKVLPSGSNFQNTAAGTPALVAAPGTQPSSSSADNNSTTKADANATLPTGPMPKPPKAIIPGEEHNSSVWVVNLPAGTTEKIFLDAMTAFGPFGRILSCEIIPGGPGHKHPQAACAVAFFERASAKRLLEYIVNQKFRIQNRTIPHAYWNKKFLIPPQERSGRSRVLIIQGSDEICDVHTLEAFLKGKKLKLKTQSLEIVEDRPFKSHRTLIWTFVSYIGMAEPAMVLLTEAFDGLRVTFGSDPVEHGAVVASERDKKDSLEGLTFKKGKK